MKLSKAAALAAILTAPVTKENAQAIEIERLKREYAAEHEPCQAGTSDVMDEKELRKSEFKGFRDDRRQFQNVQKHKMKGRVR